MNSILIPAATAAMFGYMLWLVVFRLRHDRVRTERRLTKGRFAFSPKHRLRFLLTRSFEPADEEPEWQEPLLSKLSATGGESSGVPEPTKSETPRVSAAQAD